MSAHSPATSRMEMKYVSIARLEERAAPRFALMMRQAKLRSRSGEFLCVIRDVSATGISVRTFHPLPLEDRMAIELRERCPYLIEKVWEKDNEAGFRFRDPVNLAELLEDDRRFPRRQIRIAIDLPVQISSGGETGPATFENISQQGARMLSERVWAREQLLRVRAWGIPDFYAKVRWRRDDVHGLVFENTIAFREFAYLLARLQGVV